MSDEHLNGLYFVLNILCNIGFLYIFLEYFMLIWVFYMFTDEKWQKRDETELKEPFWLMLKKVGSKLVLQL